MGKQAQTSRYRVKRICTGEINSSLCYNIKQYIPALLKLQSISSTGNLQFDCSYSKSFRSLSLSLSLIFFPNYQRIFIVPRAKRFYQSNFVWELEKVNNKYACIFNKTRQYQASKLENGNWKIAGQLKRSQRHLSPQIGPLKNKTKPNRTEAADPFPVAPKTKKKNSTRTQMMFIGIGHCLRHALWQRLSETRRDPERL